MDFEFHHGRHREKGSTSVSEPQVGTLEGLQQTQVEAAKTKKVQKIVRQGAISVCVGLPDAVCVGLPSKHEEQCKGGRGG